MTNLLQNGGGLRDDVEIERDLDRVLLVGELVRIAKYYGQKLPAAAYVLQDMAALLKDGREVDCGLALIKLKKSPPLAP